MIASRCQLAAFSILLISSVAAAQQPYLASATTGQVELHSVPIDELYLPDPVIESLSDRPMPLSEGPVSLSEGPAAFSERPTQQEPSEVTLAASCAACGCGKKSCHGVCTDPGRPRKPIIDKPGDRDRGDCPPKRYGMPDCQRAGNPHCVAWWAQCSVNDKYSSWFVGGGSPFRRGRCRKPSEGTWGLDYGGLFGHAKVWLNYTRHEREQGGEGAYRTDGEPAFVSKAHSLLHLGH